MANRFNTLLENQPYVSTYIPTPFDEIIKMGAMKQGRLDEETAKLDISEDPLNKIGNLSFTLKTYDRNGHIVDQSNTDLEDYKKAKINQLVSERSQLASDLATGKISDSDFFRLSKQHTQKAAQTYNELAGYKNNIETIQKANEEYAKSKDFGLDPTYGTDMLEYNTNYLENAKKGIFNPYAQQAIADKFDMQKAVLDFKFKDASEKEDISIGDFIQKYGIKGVTPERVKYAANRIFSDPSSDIYRNARLSLEHQIRLNPSQFKTQDDIEKAWQLKKENFVQAAIAEHAGLIEDKEVSANPFSLEKYKKELQTPAVDPWTTFTPEQPGVGSDRDSRLTAGLPANMQEHMMYKDGKLVSKQPKESGFWDTIKNVAEFISSPVNFTAKAKLDGVVAIKHAVESYKDIQPILLNYGIATGRIKSEKDLNNKKTFDAVKDAYSVSLADAIIANRDVSFDQTTADKATGAILPTVNNKGEILNPNLMASTSIYDLNGNLIDDQSILGGGKILGPDSRNAGRLLMASRNGKQYSIDPNIPDLKLTTTNINNFDKMVIDRVATGAVTNDTKSLQNYYHNMNSEIDKVKADPKVKENIKLNYNNNINNLVSQGYKMTTAYYGSNEIPVGIKYNPDGTVEKKVIAEVPGQGATIMDIGEYKSMMTQDAFRNAGILPQLSDEAKEAYKKASFIR